MKPTRVLSYKQLPIRLPIWPTIVVWLLLDRLQPADWVWGAVLTAVALIWAIAIISVCNQQTVEINELK